MSSFSTGLHGRNAESSEFILIAGILLQRSDCTGVLVCKGWPGKDSGEVKIGPCNPLLVLGSIGVRQMGFNGRFSFSDDAVAACTAVDHVSSGRKPCCCQSDGILLKS